MTLPAGTVCMTVVEDKLRDMCANSATFQTLVGAANATEAKTSIFVNEATPPANKEEYTDDELEALIPHALVFTDREEGFVWNKIADMQTFDNFGTLWLRIRDDIPAADIADPEKFYRDFAEIVATIVNEMTDLITTYLMVQQFVATGPFREQDDENSPPKPWLSYDIQVNWGFQ